MIPERINIEEYKTIKKFSLVYHIDEDAYSMVVIRHKVHGGMKIIN